MSKSNWNSLEVVKLGVSLLTPLLLFWLGFMTNSYIRHSEYLREDSARQRQLERTRQKAVQRLSQFIYERRTRAELLASSLKRHAVSPTPESHAEVIERKKLYDDAYFHWNSNHQANLLLVRQVLGADEYSAFENFVEVRLVQGTFAPLDSCLTRAFDAAVRDNDPRALLQECNAVGLLQRALDCGYAITNELFKLSGPTGDLIQSGDVVNMRCP